MKGNDVSALFNELKDAYELKLDELKKEGEISTKKYQEDVQRFCEEREEEYDGLEYFLAESTQLLKSEAASIWVDAVLQGKFDKYLYISLCYYHLAFLVSGRERITDGCKYIQDAMYFYGKWQGSRENKEWAKNKEKNEAERRENAKKAKEEKYLPIKFEIIRLLYSKKPLGKWTSISKAIEDIQQELVLFLKNEPKDKSSKLDSSNLGRTIKGWLETDRYLEIAFSEAVLKK
ncbi:TPA: hypothetical protein ACGTP8_002211 [Yersinia enterocolitica]|uniref:hypothetical protein n=1 Tax=Yersinia massiliensis TaxID=419257 RepID=UPI0028D1351D|nr:hypothetical protein [Yersinia massiliensis]